MTLIAGLTLILSEPATAPDYFVRLPDCTSETAPIETPCTLPTRISARSAERLLGPRHHAWWLLGDQLTMVGRFGAEGWDMLCCAIQTPLEPLGESGIGAVTVRVPHVDEALLDAGLSLNGGPPVLVPTSHAPARPARVEPLRGSISGRVVHSDVLGEDRRIMIYVPPDARPDVRLPVIYLADGDIMGFAPVMEALVRDGRAAPAIIVGIRSEGTATGCVSQPCDRRMLEYLVQANPSGASPDSAFGRHLRFVTEEVIPLVERDFPASSRPQDRITSGFSNGGAWALAAAILRPDLFRNVLALSDGAQWAAEHAEPLRGARVYVGAGLFETGFLARMRAAAAAASAAGAEVHMREIVSGHSRAMWEIMVAEGVAWLLPPRPNRDMVEGN